MYKRHTKQQIQDVVVVVTFLQMYQKNRVVISGCWKRGGGN